MNRLLRTIFFALFITLFSPIVSYALSLAEGQITFDIPEALELQSSELKKFNEALSGIVKKSLMLTINKLN